MSKIPLYPHSDIADPMRGAVHHPQAVIAVVAAAAATFGPVLLGGAAATIGALGVFGSFLLRAGLGLAMYALSESQAPKGTAGGYKVTASGTALNHQIIYGRAKCAGVRIYDGATGTNNSVLHRVIAFAGHEIDSFVTIYIGDEAVTLDATGNVTSPARFNGYVRILKGLGSDTQTAMTEMVAEVPGWTTNHRLRGIAYLYIKFTYSKDLYPNGIPEITAVIGGKKVYDPRDGLTTHKTTSALCIRDYLTNPDYGLGAADSEIDDVLVEVAANVCDQTVGGIGRYKCNGNFTTGGAPVDILRGLLTSMGGLLWYSQGKWRMKAASYTAPVEDFTIDDLRSEVTVSTRNSRRTNFNTVRGTFRGAETNWQTTDYASVSDPFFVDTEDGGEVVEVDYNLPFTFLHKATQRLARIFLKRNREQITVSAAFSLKAFRVQVGDNITLTLDRYGWTSKVFEVISWTFTITEELDIQVQMSLRETSSAVYTDVDGSVLALNNTNLPSPVISSAPTGLTAVNAGFLGTDGKYTNGISFSWNPINDAFVTAYIVKWKKTADTKWNTAYVDEDTFYGIPATEDLTQYSLRVKGLNSILGVSGPSATITFTTGQDTTAPGLPTGITAVGGFRSISLSWTNPTDLDLDHIQIWEASTNSSASATLVGRAFGSTFTRSNLGSTVTRYYFLKSVDHTGNVSAFTASVNATTTKIITGDVTDKNIIRAYIESGAISDLLATTSTVAITDSASTNYSTYMLFATHTHSFGTTSDTSPEEVYTQLSVEFTDIALAPSLSATSWRHTLSAKVEIYRKDKTTLVETLLATAYGQAQDVIYRDGYAKYIFDVQSLASMSFYGTFTVTNFDLVFKYYWYKTRTDNTGSLYVSEAIAAARTLALFR